MPNVVNVGLPNRLKDGVEKQFLHLAVWRRLLYKDTTTISKQLVLIKLEKMASIVL